MKDIRGILESAAAELTEIIQPDPPIENNKTGLMPFSFMQGLKFAASLLEKEDQITKETADVLNILKIKFKASIVQKEETFTIDNIEQAIKLFLEFGEASFGKCHKGYFSLEHGGWPARALKYHIKKLGEGE